jgi:putative transcriptional regulator
LGPDEGQAEPAEARAQGAFAAAIGVPVATVRNWEQSRTSLDPAVRSLLRIVEREPDAALRALAV